MHDFVYLAQRRSKEFFVNPISGSAPPWLRQCVEQPTGRTDPASTTAPSKVLLSVRRALFASSSNRKYISTNPEPEAIDRRP